MSEYMIRNVILDFGNVLGTFDKHTACEKLAAYSKTKSGAEIYDLLVGSKLETLLESGAIDEQAFAAQLISSIDASHLSNEKCLEIWSDIFKSNPGMTNLLTDLRRRGVALAVLSTTNAAHWPYIRKLDIIQLLESWDVPFILSHQEKAIKPAVKLYVAALAALGCAAHEAVFVDDIPENVEAARKLGMAGIEYNCTKDSLDYLRDSLSRVFS